jgi:hypothetical protein
MRANGDGVGRGILAIWHDIMSEHETDTLEWYDRQHHFERIDIHGFIGVRRYDVIEGAPRLFIRYETRDVDVLSSEAYVERVNNPTPWTLRSQPRMRNYSRTVCVRRGRVGRAEGGFVVTIRLQAEGAVNITASWDWRRAAAGLAQAPGILGVEFWEADSARSTIVSKEKQLRGEEDRYVGAVLVIHASGREAAAKAGRDALAGMPPEVARSAEAGLYGLVYIAENATS